MHKITQSVLGIAALLALAVPTIASANTFSFTQPAKSAVATTSLAYMTPGTGTTTLTYDSYTISGTNQTDIGDRKAARSGALLAQFNASSTSSTLLINQEYSQDGIDWYQSAPLNLLGQSTTTTPVAIGPVPQYQWLFASSTPGLGAVSSTTSTDGRLVIFNTPTRFTRFVFTLKIGGTNGAVWATVVPIKENTQ